MVSIYNGKQTITMTVFVIIIFLYVVGLWRKTNTSLKHPIMAGLQTRIFTSRHKTNKFLCIWFSFTTQMIVNLSLPLFAFGKKKYFIIRSSAKIRSSK